MSAALLVTLALATGSAGDRFDFDARLALGPAARLDNDASTDLAFEGGVLFRYRLLDKSAGLVPTLLPEISYLALFDEGRRDDIGVLGFGYGWTAGPLVLGVVPGLAFGSFRHDRPEGPVRRGVGLRVVGIAELTHYVGIQAGYLGAYSGGGWRHEVFATASLNFLGLAILFLYGSR